MYIIKSQMMKMSTKQPKKTWIEIVGDSMVKGVEERNE